MFSLLMYLAAGAVIVFFASANAHLIVVNFGLIMVQTPLFVIMGICFFAGFAVAVVTVLAKTSFRRKKRPVGKEVLPRMH